MAEVAKKTVVVHEGVNHGRTLLRFSLRERIFAKAWQEVNEPRSSSFNVGVLQTLLSREKPKSSSEFMFRVGLEAITPRDAEVAATAIQWLGSNIGFGFLRKVMKGIESLEEDRSILENSENRFEYSRKKMGFSDAIYAAWEMVYLKRNSDSVLDEYIQSHLENVLEMSINLAESEKEALEIMKVIASVKGHFPNFKKSFLASAFRKSQKIIVG